MEIDSASEVDSVLRARLHQFDLKPFEVILVFKGKVKSADDLRVVTENARAVMNSNARLLWAMLDIPHHDLHHRLKQFWDIDNQASTHGSSLEEDRFFETFQNTEVCSGFFSHRSLPGSG